MSALLRLSGGDALLRSLSCAVGALYVRSISLPLSLAYSLKHTYTQLPTYKVMTNAVVQRSMICERGSYCELSVILHHRAGVCLACGCVEKGAQRRLLLSGERARGVIGDACTRQALACRTAPLLQP